MFYICYKVQKLLWKEEDDRDQNTETACYIFFFKNGIWFYKGKLQCYPICLNLQKATNSSAEDKTNVLKIGCIIQLKVTTMPNTIWKTNAILDSSSQGTFKRDEDY